MQRTTIIFMFMDPTHTHGVAPKDATAGPGRQRVCLAIASRRQAGAEIHMMGACVRACRTVRPERASCVFVCVWGRESSVTSLLLCRLSLCGPTFALSSQGGEQFMLV